MEDNRNKSSLTSEESAHIITDESKMKSSWTSEKTGVVITINNIFCKGCVICVEICPTEVLEMVATPDRWEGAVAVVKDIDACTGCMLCEIQCPDFALDVFAPKKEKKEKASV